ncbi:transcriptional regulator HdfR, partial [Klebsiella pneumoniae]
ATLSRPLYAIWLQNSDQQAQIHAILKHPILE